LTTSLLALPFDFATTAYYFLHPQPHTRRQAHCERYQALERTTEHLANDDRGDEYADAENASALLQSREHGFVADGRCWVEEHIGLLAMDRHV